MAGEAGFQAGEYGLRVGPGLMSQGGETAGVNVWCFFQLQMAHYAWSLMQERGSKLPPSEDKSRTVVTPPSGTMIPPPRAPGPTRV